MPKIKIEKSVIKNERVNGKEPKAPSKLPWVSIGITLVLLIVTFVIFLQVSGHLYINFDDEAYIVMNPHVQQGLTLDMLQWAFTTNYESNWHPLTWISHTIDWMMFKDNPAGTHTINLIFHLLNIALLFWLLTRMTGSVWKSAFVAGLFALHPLHVESVAWASERKDVLSTFFWLLTMWTYVRYTERGKIGFYILSGLFLALGLLAKPMLVSLPLVLLMIDYWPLGRFATTSWKKLVIEKIPFFIIVLASCAATYWAQKTGGAMRSLHEYTLLVRVENAFVAYGWYLCKMVWPSNLTILYPHPGAGVSTYAALASAVAMVVITGLVMKFGRKAPYLTAGWLWYIVTLIPVIGIVQVGDAAMADRYTYIPLIGIFCIIAWGVPEALKWMDVSEGGRVWGLGAVAVAVLGTFSYFTYQQLGYWQDTVSILGRTVEVTQNNYTAENNLGSELILRGQYAEAADHLEAATRIKPLDGLAYDNLGIAYEKLDRMDDAIAMFRKAGSLKKDYGEAHCNLGDAMMLTHHTDEAIKEYKLSIALDPKHSFAYHNLGKLLGEQGKVGEAIEMFSKAVEIAPTDPIAHADLGQALCAGGRIDEAVEEAQKAIDLDPRLGHAYGVLALANYTKGDLVQAWQDVHQCQALGGMLAPDFITALNKRMPEPAR